MLNITTKNIPTGIEAMSFVKANTQETLVISNRCVPINDLSSNGSINTLSEMDSHEGGGCLSIGQHEVSSMATNNGTEKWVLSSSLGDVGVETVTETPPTVLHAIDPDELFFKSLLPDVQLLGPQQKGVFKLKVQQLLQEKLYPKVCSCSVNGEEDRSDTAIHSSSIPLPNQTSPVTSEYAPYGVFSDRWPTNGHGGVNFCEYSKSN